MDSRVVLSVLLACGLSVSANAAEDAANRALLKQCESAKGEVKEECREVAKKMIKDDQPATERDDQTSQDITHSSPAMTTAEETEREAAKKKHKPVEKSEATPPKRENPEPAK